MVEAFAEVTLETRDPACLARFYRDAFGFELLSRGDDRVWLAIGSHARLGLWRSGTSSSEGRAPARALLRCDDSIRLTLGIRAPPACRSSTALVLRRLVDAP